MIEDELGELERLAALSELTAEELIARGEQLIKLGRLLAAQSAGAILPVVSDVAEQRSVGRLGIVTEREAIAAATDLGEFTRKEFAVKLGLKGAAVSRWLSKLIDRDNPIIERTDDGYRYVPPPNTAPRSRPRRPESKEVVADLAPDRGTPVPVPATQRAPRGDLSKPGRGHQIRQTDKRHKHTQEVRAARQAQRDRKRRNGTS